MISFVKKLIYFLIGLFILILPFKTLAQELPYPNIISSLKFQVSVSQKSDYQVSEEFQFAYNPPDQFSWFINSLKISDLKIYRQNSQIPASEYQLKKHGDQTIISGLRNFSSQNSWQIFWTQKGQITPADAYDEVRFQPVSEFGLYINELEIIIQFPEKIDPSQMKAVYYAIHGVESTDATPIEAGKVKYYARNLSPFATYTCVVNIPKGIISISKVSQLVARFNLLSFDYWLIPILAVPLLVFLTIVLMVYFKRRQENIQIPVNVLEHRPAPLDAPLVGILFRQKVGPREIAAILLNLALKGYLMINELYQGYSFGQKKQVANLRPYEKAVADELLKGRLKESLAEFKEQPEKELFSQSVSKIYEDLYGEIAKLGYFIEDPKIVSIRYKIFGIIMFFVSVLFFFVSPLVSPEYPFKVFVFLGTAIASLVIINLSETMPKRTDKGKKALQDWLAFRKFLVEYSKPVGFEQVQEEIFIKYLPYAVALGVEREWASHFTKTPLKVPDWYNSFRTIDTLPSLTQGLYPLIDGICKIMMALKEPIL